MGYTSSNTNGASPEVTEQAERVEFQVAASDLTTALTTGDGKAYFRPPCNFELTEVRASLSNASSSGKPTWDVRKNGTSIFTTKIEIDANEKTSESAAIPHVLDPAQVNIADDDELIIDQDVAGTGALGAILTFIGVRTS